MFNVCEVRVHTHTPVDEFLSADLPPPNHPVPPGGYEPSQKQLILDSELFLQRQQEHFSHRSQTKLDHFMQY